MQMLRKKLSILLKSIFESGLKWFLIFLTFSPFALIFIYPLFAKIKLVECSTQYGICSEKINQELKKFVGKTIFSGIREIKFYLSKDVLIKGSTVRLIFPNTIKVDLLIKKPSFCIGEGDLKKFALVDNDGIVLAFSDNCALPRIITKAATRIEGEKVSDSELFSLKIIRGIYEMYQVQVGKMDADLVVELPKEVTVIFPIEGDSDVLLGALRLIYTKIQNQALEKKYKEIDLRFNAPVLR